MKKGVIAKVLVSVMSLAMVLTIPTVSLAAERGGEPVEKSVAEDGKTHSVCVFGTSLALVSTDGSIEISPIGGLTGVDVMIDGVVTKNVSTFSAPAGQKTRMTLDEGSVIVNNVTAESGAAVKQQINEAYAAGATTVDISTLGVTAYKVDESGEVKDASGSKINSSVVGVEVRSVEEAGSSFTKEIEEIRQVQIAAENEAKAAQAASSTSSSSSTSSTSSSSTVSGNSL